LLGEEDSQGFVSVQAHILETSLLFSVQTLTRLVKL
jgi:hypothetical protein